MIGEIRRVKCPDIDYQLPLFYQHDLDNALVLVTALVGFSGSYADVFNNGRIYTIPYEYLKHVS